MNKKILLASAIALTLGTGPAQASTWSGTFTMYDIYGETPFGSDTTVTGEELVSLSSSTPFLGRTWMAHDLTIYGEGTYTIDTNEGGVYTVDVAAGQLMGHVLWDSGTTTNTDMVNVWDVTVVDGLRYYTSTDWDGDGILGGKMIDGDFPGFSANFDMVSSVPVPAAVWLFGSGLLGLMGFAHRKKKV